MRTKNISHKIGIRISEGLKMQGFQQVDNPHVFDPSQHEPLLGHCCS